MGLCKERESKRIITLKVSEKESICGENESTHGGIYTYSRIDCTALLNHRALSFTAHIQMYIYIYIYIYNLFLWVIETKHVLIETGIFISCLLLVGGVCELVPPVVAEGSTDYSMELAAQTDPQI